MPGLKGQRTLASGSWQISGGGGGCCCCGLSRLLSLPLRKWPPASGDTNELRVEPGCCGDCRFDWEALALNGVGVAPPPDVDVDDDVARCASAGAGESGPEGEVSFALPSPLVAFEADAAPSGSEAEAAFLLSLPVQRASGSESIREQAREGNTNMAAVSIEMRPTCG